MLKSNYIQDYSNFDTVNRIKFREELKNLLAQALIDRQPLIEGETTIVNLTEEYIAGKEASDKLRDYYNFVVYPLLEERYFHEGETSEDQMFHRVARFIARDEIDEDIFYYMMRLRLFMPATPTLMNAGRRNPMLSSCFVIVPEDDMESIADYWKVCSLVQKHGGGVGVSWDNIRPAGSAVGGTGGIASGWGPYFKVANDINEAIKQGSARSGANAATLRVDHPDIFNFVDFKRPSSKLVTLRETLDKVTDKVLKVELEDLIFDLVKDNPQKYSFFNLSLTFTDDQWETCMQSKDLALHHPKGQGSMIVDGRAIIDRMAENAWMSGDPSPYWIDKANRTWDKLVLGRLDPWGVPYGRRITHNPCGEQCLQNHGACNLGSINLMALIDPIKKKMHMKLFENVSRAALRFLDAVIDRNWFPDERITIQSKHLRNVGLGFMGLSDMFHMMGIEYGSELSVAQADMVSQYMTDWAWSESKALGETLGAAPVFMDGGNHDYVYRNTDVTCIAPTGSISLLSLANNGIEPYFSTHYKKLVYPKGHPDKKKYIDIIPPALMYFPLNKPPKTAMGISPYRHVDVLAAVSRNVTNAVSKTVNLPNEYSVDNITDIYQYAFEQGCTSITVFRDGCRPDLALINQAEEDPHDWLLETPQEERDKMITREPFSMDRFKEMAEEEGHDTVFDEDHDVVQNSRGAPIHGKKSLMIMDDNGKPVPPTVFNSIIVPKYENFEQEYQNNPVMDMDKFNEVAMGIGDLGDKRRGICQGCGSNDVRRQEGCIYCNECPWSMCSTS